MLAGRQDDGVAVDHGLDPEELRVARRDERKRHEQQPHGPSVVASRRVMRLEHLFDLDLRYEGEYVVVRPYGGQDGIGYAAGTGRATGPRVEGDVRFSNNPRVRGDGVLLPALDGCDRDGRRRPHRLQLDGSGRKEADGRRFRALLAMTFESGDERYAWLNESLCIGDAIVTGRHVQMQVHRLVTEGN